MIKAVKDGDKTQRQVISYNESLAASQTRNQFILRLGWQTDACMLPSASDFGQ